MRTLAFTLLVLCLFTSIGFSQTDTFHLRIENLHCVSYQYQDLETRRLIQYQDFGYPVTITPVDGMATIETESETFQFGFAPSKTSSVRNNPGEVNSLNLGVFRFTRKENPDNVRASLSITYAFDLTDGTTTYKLTLRINSWGDQNDRKTDFILSSNDTLIIPGTTNSPSFVFPQSAVNKNVLFKFESFKGSWDMIPLVATITTAEKSRTLREIRSSKRNGGTTRLTTK